jgi:Zn-dependent protease with chaperone function
MRGGIIAFHLHWPHRTTAETTLRPAAATVILSGVRPGVLANHSGLELRVNRSARPRQREARKVPLPRDFAKNARISQNKCFRSTCCYACTQMPKLSFVSVIPITLLLAACAGNHAGDERSESAHTARTPVFQNEQYFWANTDYETFRSVAQRAPFQTDAPLGNEPLTTRLQAWANAIHAVVSVDVKSATGKDLVTPRPIVVIVPAKQANGWVSGIPACLTDKADLSSLGLKSRLPRTAALAFLEYGKVREAYRIFGGPPPRCVDPKNWPPSKAPFLKFFESLGAQCKVSNLGAGIAVNGTGCELVEPSTGPTEASQLTMYVPSPFIHITTAAVALAETEEAIASVIAHELGHYYRSHAVAELAMNKFNYWYQQTAIPKPQTPAPLADSAALETRFQKTMPFPMARVQGQRFGYRLTSFLVDPLARALSEAKLCAGTTVKLGEWTQSFAVLGPAFATKETQKAYLEYEEALIACAATVPLFSGDKVGALNRAKLQEAMGSLAAELALPAIEATTMGEALSRLNERALKAGAEADAFLLEVKQRSLGRYTAEQEADEFAVEYLSRVGVEPKTQLETNLQLLKARGALDPEAFAAANGGLDLSSCEKLYRNGWTSKDASNTIVPAIIPLGNLHDSHHGGCYRLYNMSQEVRAHKTVASGSAPTKVDWKPLREIARKATAEFELSPVRAALPAPQVGGAPSTLERRAADAKGVLIFD